MKKILVIVPMIFMLAFSLILSGCGAAKAPGPAGKKSAAATAPPKSNSSEVVIGAVASLTGVNTETGEAQEWAYKQAVADVNAAGGLDINGKKMPVKLILADDTSTTSGAAAAAESLIKVDGCKLLLSTNTTPMNIAMGTVAEKYKVYLAMNTCWIDAATPQNWKWVSDMFFTTTQAGSVPFEIWNSLSPAARPKRIALLMMDNSDGQGYAKSIANVAKNLHYNVALNEPFTPGSKDFSSEILKMKSMDIDAVLFLGAPTDGITIVRQAKQLKFEPKYFMGWMGFWPVAVAQALGPDSNYLIHDGFWSEEMPYPGAAKLGKEYSADHNGMTSPNIGLPYACAQVLFKAIENAGSTDPAEVRDATFGHEFDGTVLGNIKFNTGGEATTPSILLQWYNQKRYLLWPKFTNVKWQIHAFNTGAVLH